MSDETKSRQDIIEIGRRLYNRGFIVACEGNLSIRLNETEILTTCSGVCKGYLTPEQVLKIDMNGNALTGGKGYEPSTEILMHLAVYQERPDIAAIVHAHPPTATGFAVAGLPLDKCVLPEIILTIGSIPLADYGTPSTGEIPDRIRTIIRGRDALLLANHGALTVSKDIYQAYYHMESVEQYAKIMLVARLLGGEKPLTPQQVSTLIETHPGSEKLAQACYIPTNTAQQTTTNEYVATCAKEEGQMAEAELVMKITEEIAKRLQNQQS